MKRKFLSYFLLMFLAMGIFGQGSTPILKIASAKGNELSVQGATKFETWNLTRDNPTGTELGVRELLLTGGGSSVELVLLPLGISVYITENTSLRVDSIGSAQVSMELIFGRVRISQAGAENTEAVTFKIKTRDGVYSQAGGDFALDYQAGGEVPGLWTRISVFKGSGTAVGQVVGDSQVRLVGPGRISLGQGGAFSDAVVNQTLLQTMDTMWQGLFPPRGGETEPSIGLSQVEPIPSPGPTTNNASTTSPSPERQTVPPSTPQRPTLAQAPGIADQLPPIIANSVLDLLPHDQYVRGKDIKKQIGILGIGAGLATILASAVLGNFGSDFYDGLDTDTRLLLANGGLIVGATLSTTGTVFYLWGLIER